MPDLLNTWKNGLQKTSKAAFGRISGILGTSEIDEEVWDDLEVMLLQSDVGVKATGKIIRSLKNVVSTEGITTKEEFTQKLQQVLNAILVSSDASESGCPSGSD